MVCLGGARGPIRYVAPVMLQLAGQPGAPGLQACHSCPTGPPWHGLYSCVDLDHLRWGTQTENEADKGR